MSSTSKFCASEPKVQLRRKFKTKSSKYFCQEKLACRGPHPEAHYKCCECDSYQCEACESVLHETAKFLFHDRIRLPLPDIELLCQWDCKERNFADIICTNCNKKLCNFCDFEIHAQGKKRTHVRKSFKSASTEEPVQDIVDIIPSSSMKPSANNSLEYQSLNSLNSHSWHSDSVNTAAVIDSNISNDMKPGNSSFLLVNNEEELQVHTEGEFLKRLHAESDVCVKVVSIFGNTGEGKSHTLNHTFFNGREVFHTSAAQQSSTIGVWSAYDSDNQLLVIDTEGLLGVASNQNKRTRLLLKVLAVSDIIIYRTRAGRLHNDLFQFLGDASQAYLRHFRQELNAVSERCNLDGPLSTLGPAAILFHETQHTDILKRSQDKTPEDQLKQRFCSLSCSIEAYSVLEYVGVRTENMPTNFDLLKKSVLHHMKNSLIRSPRKPSIIFQALKVLNEKFSGDIDKTVPNMFPDQYFTCPVFCASCNVRCVNSMNHSKDGSPHFCNSKCKYTHQFENRIFMCKHCYEQGQEVVVVPKTSAATDSTWFGLAKYAWAGYVLECKSCGIIYRSRQYWYGNRDPVETSVRTEIQHVWPGENCVLQGTYNAAWKVIDSVAYLSNTVSNVGAKPTKLIANWVTDQVAPSYWISNSQIKECSKCSKIFHLSDKKHHCRACGRGFCSDCSANARPVPERGWGMAPVRVCDDCYENSENSENEAPNCISKDIEPDGQELIARKVTEVIQSTIGTVVSAIDYPLELIKDSARPTYWVPDHLILECYICKTEFDSKITKHHCRSCGNGVCGECSPHSRPVTSRGWDIPVRICNECIKKVA